MTLCDSSKFLFFSFTNTEYELYKLSNLIIDRMIWGMVLQLVINILQWTMNNFIASQTPQAHTLHLRFLECSKWIFKEIYLVKYSLDVFKKKTKVFDIFNTDKRLFIKNNIESSPREIWIRIRFLEINGSPSLDLIHDINSSILST